MSRIFVLSFAIVVFSGVCFAGEIKRAKVGDYEYSYYVETNGTAVIGRVRNYSELEQFPGSNDPDQLKFLSSLFAITPSPKGRLVVPSSIDGHRVSAVGLVAFAGCGDLETVVLPEGIEYIGEGSFLACSNLVDLTLPISLKEIREAAFRSCARLEKLVLTPNIKEIGESALYGCEILNFIRIPASLEKSGGKRGLCEGLKSLRSVYFEDGVTHISS